MRQAVLGFVLGAGLLTAVAAILLTFSLAPGNSVLAQHARAPAPKDGDLIALHWTVVEGGKQLEAVLLVDPQRKAMSVYHIDRVSGVIALKSGANATATCNCLSMKPGRLPPKSAA